MTKTTVSLVMEIAQQMVESGAEISRVEESITRICEAYGCEPEVYATSSNVIVSVLTEAGTQYTQTRRIKGSSLNIERVHLLNDLVRRICSSRLSDDQIDRELKDIARISPYPRWLCVLFYAVIAASFCLFFGSRSWLETLFSAGIGALVGLAGMGLDWLRANRILSRFLCSFLACASSLLLWKGGVAATADYMIIGNIMSLIPGIGLTNALKDLFTGDTVTGMLRFLEAGLLAAAIAFGFWAAVFVTGGIV